MQRSRFWRMIGLPGVLSVVASAGYSSLFGFGDSTKEFIPAEAEVVDGSDCSLWDPFQQVTDWYPSTTESSIAQMGYPPADFSPVEVVRCERGQDEAGTLTIDTVRLDGDIAAVADAFRTPSRQFRDENTMVSCAIVEHQPAGLWLVDADGQAIRPQWPLRPCGFLPNPSDPLAALDEVDRTSDPVVGVPADDPGVCLPSNGSPFSVTTGDDVDEAIETEDQRTGYHGGDNELATPIDDVGRLQVCSSTAAPGGFVEQPGARLTLADSRRLTAAAAQSSIAPACTEVASRVATSIWFDPMDPVAPAYLPSSMVAAKSSSVATGQFHPT